MASLLRMIIDNQHMIMLALHEVVERLRKQEGNGIRRISESPDMTNHVAMQREALRRTPPVKD